MTSGEDAPPPDSHADAAPHSPSEILERLRARPNVEVRYRSKGEMARGGMGAILRVFDADLRRHLAMKVMLDGPGASDASQSAASAAQRRHARFLEEAQITGQLDHPGIVPVHELGLDASGRLYFTMKLVRGRDLREVFKLVRTGGEDWNLTRALGVLLRVCEAMAFAHEKGVIHRDIKPANIMVGRFGEVYVMDWGLAKVLGRPDAHDVRIAAPSASRSLVRTERKDLSKQPDSPLATMDGDVVGTPCYMPPEQARGRLEDIGPHSDVYSLGSMLYELLSGEMPYAGKDETTSPFVVLGQLIQGPPKELGKLAKDVPDELIAICEKAMARDLRERYPSMSGVADDLRAFLEGRVVKAHRTGAVAEFRKWISRNKGFAGAVAAAVAVVIVLSIVMVSQQVRARASLQVALDDADLQRQLAEGKRLEAEEAQRKAEGAFAMMAQVNTQLSSAKKSAEANAELARLGSYTANIAAAAASLRVHDLESTRARLAQCPEPLRRWEWRYLNARVAPAMSDLTQFVRAPRETVGFGDSGVKIAIDPTETFLLAAGSPTEAGTADRSALHGIDLESGAKVWERPLDDGFVITVASSADHRRAAVLSTSKRVVLFDMITRTELANWKASSTPLFGAALNHDGSRMLFATTERRVLVADTNDGTIERELENNVLSTACAFSPDDRWLAIGASDGRVYVYDATHAAPRAVLSDAGAPIRHLQFSRDGERLIAAAGTPLEFSVSVEAWANTVREWELATGRLLSIWSDHTAEVSWCDYARGEEVVASASADGTIRIRGTHRAEEVVLATDGRRIVSAQKLRDGHALVTVDAQGALRTWDTTFGTHLTLTGHRIAVEQIEFLNDGVRLISRGQDGGARIWDTRSGEQVAVLNRLTRVLNSVMDRSVTMATSPLDGRVAFGFSRGRVFIIDVDAVAEPAELSTASISPVTALAFDATARRLAAGKDDGYVTVLDIGSGAALLELRGTEGPISALAWIEDGAHLAVGTREGAFSVWDITTGTQIALVPKLGSAVWRIGASPDGRAIHFDTNGVVHSVAAGTYALEESRHFTGAGGSLRRIGNEPRVFGRIDGGVAVFDDLGGQPRLDFRFSEAVRSVATSRDGRRLAAATDQGTIRVWTDESTAELARSRRLSLRARELALPRVSELFETRALDREAAEAELLRDETISESLREAALHLVRATRGEPMALRYDCLVTLRWPKSEYVDYKVALWRALAMQRTDARDDRAALFEAAARFRLGDLDGAERAMARSIELRTSARVPSEQYAFQALIACRRGRIEEARENLARLQEAIRKQLEANRQILSELAAEVVGKLAQLEG